jgi:hypothetical protein
MEIIIKTFLLLLFVFGSTILLVYLYIKIPQARRMMVPMRCPELGECITFIGGKHCAYDGMNGIVSWISADKQAYSIHTGGATLVVPSRNAFGKVLPDKYLLHKDNKVYRNR